MEIMNQVRGYAFLCGVLKKQQTDPYCRSCNSYVGTLATTKQNVTKFESEHADEIRSLPEEVARLFAEATSGIAAMTQPANPAGQKKEGNCKLPEGVCFLKSSLALLQKI